MEIICSPVVSDLGDILCRIASLLRAIIPLLLGIGVVYFVWGVVQYVIGASDDETRKKGRDRMVFGIIGLAIITSLWGIVFLVVNTFGLRGDLVPPSTLLVPNTQIVQSTAGDSCNFAGSEKRFQDLVRYGTCLIGAVIIPFIFALATVVFMWGAVQFLVMGAGDEEKRTKGKQLMIWGIIALAVMIGVWGLVEIVGNTFGIDTGFLPQIRPQ